MLVTEEPVRVDWAQINIVFEGSWQIYKVRLSGILINSLWKCSTLSYFPLCCACSEHNPNAKWG